MRALTLYQPWASAIGRVKWIETRSWETKYRGELAIHAAVRSPKLSRDYLATFAQQTGIGEAPAGAVVSIARLVDVVPVETLGANLGELERYWGDYAAGRFAWVLEDVRFLEQPVPCSGRQGLWNWNPPAIDDLKPNPNANLNANLNLKLNFERNL